MARAKHIVIGLLVTRDDRDLVDRLAAELPEALRERVARDVDWRVEAVETDPADVAAGPGDLIESVRRRLIERRWQLAIRLTALPLAAHVRARLRPLLCTLDRGQPLA